MPVFQHPLWGYQLTYPGAWAHASLQLIEGFAPTIEALTPGDSFAAGSHLLLRAAWNSEGQPVNRLWAQHIGQLAGFMGAKQVGSAAWRIGSGVGLEAEILMPKHENRRLWAGILSFGRVILQLAVEHPREERPHFEPVVTEIIKSIQMLKAVEGIEENACGLPVPPGYREVPAQSVIADIPAHENWQAYDGSSPAGALQAFTVRESMARGWKLLEMLPYPGPSELGFARFRFSREGSLASVGIMPYGGAPNAAESPARVVIRYRSAEEAA